MLFTQNLLPLLNAAGSSNELARVVSVLAAGREGKLVESDLDLKTNYSLSNAAGHAVTMTDLAMEHLAHENPDVGFVHTYPSGVRTGIGNALPAPLRLGMQAMYILGAPLMVPLEQSGERNLFHSTSLMYPPAHNKVGAPLPEGGKVSKDSEGGEGTNGAYLLNWNGEATGKEALLKGYRDRGFPKTIWEHTVEVFDKESKS